MKKLGTMLAMIAASEAATRSYEYSVPSGQDDYEYIGGLAIRKKFQAKKKHYTVDSPEVKRMSKG